MRALFERQYREEVERIGPDELQMARLMKTLEGGAGRPVNRRRGHVVFAAAALAAVLCVTAIAASPTLREALIGALGSFEPYSQTVEGISDADQGIEIKVVSIVADETDGTAYVEVTDLAGDRLDESTVLLESTFSVRPTAYDPETKTALYAVPLRYIVDDLKPGDTLELSFHGLRPGWLRLPYEEKTRAMPEGYNYGWWEGTALPKALYSTQTLADRRQTEEEWKSSSRNKMYADDWVLVPDQTPADLGSEYFSLSSAGFDREGHFHIQLALADGVYLWDALDLDIDILPGVTLGEAGLTEGLEYRQVLLEGGRYLDVTYLEVTPEILARLPDGTIYGTVYTAPAIDGAWTISLPFEPMPGTRVELDQPFCYEGVDLLDAQLTAMSFQLTFTSEIRFYMGGQPVCLFCKDGTMMELDFNSQSTIYRNAEGEIALGQDLTYEQHQGADGWQLYAERDSWSYPRAVAPEDVAGFSFGQWYVPLDGSGAGRWLAELPET